MKDYFADLELADTRDIEICSGGNMPSKAGSDRPVPGNTPPPAPVPGGGSPEAAAMAAGLDIIKTVITCYTDYKKCVAQEITKRQAIKAQLAVSLANIDAQKEICMLALKQDFDRREHLFKICEESLIKYQQDNNTEMVKHCYNILLHVFDADNKVISFTGNDSSLYLK